jgi:hypothetical protein
MFSSPDGESHWRCNGRSRRDSWTLGLRDKVGAERTDPGIDQPEGVALVNRLLDNPPEMREEAIGRRVSRSLAESAAYRATPGRDNEIRARQRAEALRRLRDDPQTPFFAAWSPTPNAMRRVITVRAALDARGESRPAAATFAARAGAGELWRC